MAIPFWLKIVGPAVLFALLVGGVLAWGHGKYNAGHKAGVEQTDAKWEAASQKLKAEAAKSATRADDLAAKRLEVIVAQENADRKAVEDAQAKGTSPLDAMFGGNSAQ
jgi:hypothetical protein